jgi:hypothetical protein
MGQFLADVYLEGIQFGGREFGQVHGDGNEFSGITVSIQSIQVFVLNRIT